MEVSRPKSVVARWSRLRGWACRRPSRCRQRKSWRSVPSPRQGARRLLRSRESVPDGPTKDKMACCVPGRAETTTDPWLGRSPEATIYSYGSWSRRLPRGTQRREAPPDPEVSFIGPHMSWTTDNGRHRESRRLTSCDLSLFDWGQFALSVRPSRITRHNHSARSNLSSARSRSADVVIGSRPFRWQGVRPPESHKRT